MVTTGKARESEGMPVGRQWADDKRGDSPFADLVLDGLLVLVQVSGLARNLHDPLCCLAHA